MTCCRYCEKAAFSRGLCATHLKRQQRLEAGKGKAPLDAPVREYDLPRRAQVMRWVNLLEDADQAGDEDRFEKALRMILEHAKYKRRRNVQNRKHSPD